jgi:hypothetical protein
MTRRRVIAGGVLLVAASSGIATAQTPAPDTSKTTAAAVATFLNTVQANAFVSFAYQYNFNTPDTRLNGFRVFDVDDNQLSVDVVEVVLQKPISKPGETGFRVQLAAGTGAPAHAQAYGLSLGPSGDLQQALVSYIAPVGQGLRLDFGKFVTPMGYEVIEGYDGYNDNYSRSLLFNYAIPLTHTGVKAGYAFSSTLSGMVMVVNGWDNARENNRGKSVGGQLTWVPAEPLSLNFSYIGGPEKTDTNGYVRHTFDVVASWKATKTLTLTVNGDYGTENRASLLKVGDNAVWKGVAGYARLDATSDFAVTLRGETMRDNGGTRFGAPSPATISEVTLTPSLKVGDRMVVRSDLRYDHASDNLFVKKAGLTKSQATVALNVLFVF